MTAHYGEIIGLRRSAAGDVDLRTVFYVRPTWIGPTRTPQPANRDWSWDCEAFAWDWTFADRLLIPLALALAAGHRYQAHGTHRRTDARQVVRSHRRSTR